MCLQGGYKTQTVLQLGNLISAFRLEKISLRALRLYLAALVIVAAREAAKRSRTNERQKRLVMPRYLMKELSRLTACPLPRVRGELRSLERAGLLLFSETEISFTEAPLPGSDDVTELLAAQRSTARPVPLPRPLLRLLARSRRPGTVLTMLAYCVRGLSLSRDGEVRGRGTAKASWLSEVTGQTVRSVRNARAELIARGLITDDEGSKQWKLNRDGAYFTVNLAWSEPPAVDNLAPECTTFSPPMAENCPNFSSPYEDMKTLNRSKNQETRTCGGQQAEPTGVCRANGIGEGKARNEDVPLKVKNPSLRNIQFEDLRRVSTLKMLFRQAVSAKWLEDSEANFRNFVAAAVRATRIKCSDPVRVFVAIVRRQLWHHITQEQEDRAAEVINKNSAKGLLSAHVSRGGFAPTALKDLVCNFRGLN